MKKQLLYFMCSWLMAFFGVFGAMTVSAAEEGTAMNVYGLYVSTSMGASAVQMDLNSVNADTPLNPGTVQTIDDVISSVKCGASVGNKYFAVIEDLDYKTYFASINFTTGKVVKIAACNPNKPMTGAYMSSLVYDPVSGTLYGYESTFDADYNDVFVIYSINTETGELTTVAQLKTEIVALATDGKGALYAVKNEKVGYYPAPNLYEIDKNSFALSETALIENKEKSISSSYANSCVASADGNLIYYVSGKQVVVFNLAEKTWTMPGKLKKDVYGITTVMSSEDAAAAEQPAKESMRRLVCKTQFGDAMGTQPDTQDMKKEYYFYNYDGKLVRTAKYARTYNDMYQPQDYTLERMTKKIFDENGNLTNSSEFQYGVYNYGDLALKKTYNEVNYTYNEAGQLVEENNGSEKKVYEYGEDGNVSKMSRYSARTGQLYQAIEYYDYIAPDKPTSLVSTGAWDQYVYIGSIEYNENGDKTLEVHSKQVEDPDFGMVMPMTFEVEEWEYEGTQLVTDTRYSVTNDGMTVPVSRTVYTTVDGNPDKIIAVEQNYNSDNGTWSTQAGTKYMYEYADYDGMLEQTQVEITPEVSEKPGMVDVYVTLPQFAMTGNGALVLYRDGLKISETPIYDCFDSEISVCHLTDNGVKNGEHEYFVQPVIYEVDEMGDITASAGYYISDVKDVKTYTELPVVTGLSLTGAREEAVAGTTEKNKIATVSWTNPDNRPLELFLRNELIMKGYQAAESATEDANATSLEASVTLSNYDPKVELFVLSRYTLGNVESEMLTITFNEFKQVATGVDTVADNEGNAFNFADNTFSVNGTADIAVYNAAGQLVAEAQNAGSIKINGNGAYVIIVKNANGLKAYKVSVK